MNKNLLGVITPLVLIILIIVLSISNIGFKIDEDFVKSVNYNDLFKEGLIKLDQILCCNQLHSFVQHKALSYSTALLIE